MIHPERIQALNDRPVGDGRYVLYWMQASQRANCNHALEHAIRRADERSLPVVVAFGLTDEYPEANERHYAFMLDGLAETARALDERGVRLVVRRGSPPEVAADLAADAALVVADRGYLRHQRQWREQLAEGVDCRVEQVEADVVVPVETVSDKAEYAARTIRPKHRRHWDAFLRPLEETTPKRESLGLRLPPAGNSESRDLDASDADGILASLDIDRSVPRSGRYLGGASRAEERLGAFIADKLSRYADERSDPSLDIQSHMSPYLHFGQISPLSIALRIRDASAPAAAKDAFLEELLIRRELAVNYVRFDHRYDRYDGLPEWARGTLAAHESDARPEVYNRPRLEKCDTHDPYWNAAMREMVVTGKMHNYMRMYWGKKIIEWTRSPKGAFGTMLALNNAYFIDGRDPASYANVGWCFGLHDRPWTERDVFGTVRYMNDRGLERKFDIDAYVKWTEGL